MHATRLILSVLVLWLALAPAAVAQEIPHPTDFFGFEIGTDGEMARYPKILEYLQLLADRSGRVEYEERGTTTLGNPYVLATISSPENLARMDRLVEINHRLNDPRGLSDADALALAQEGVPFYFLYATIHSTEVGNTQTIITIAHRLAVDGSPEIAEILDNVVLLVVPSQNPDGQVLVIDHWYDTEGTAHNRTYPDLYHHYAGHDDNRDWFMFTQKETRLALDIHRELKPQVTHDMHQMGSTGARIFVPPFQDPHDPNIHPLLIEGQAQIGTAMAAALIAEGKGGVVYDQQYDLWAPARQYMLYHGQPRILTEIASARLADPFVNPAGADVPLGPQAARLNFPLPYNRGTWRLGDIVDYGFTAVFAALEQVAKYRTTWMENYYRVHRDWVDRDEAPYAFVVSADQRDPFETYELLELLHTGEVEVHQARRPFTAGGEDYPTGSWVIQLAQPAGAFAKTMLEQQVYPDLRYYPGGPPIPPYDVTAQTLGLLMGVDVDQIDEPVLGDLELLDEITPHHMPMPRRPRGATWSDRNRTPRSWRQPGCSGLAYRSTAPATGSRATAARMRRAPGSCRRHGTQQRSSKGSRARPGSSSAAPTRRPASPGSACAPRRGWGCGGPRTTCRVAGCAGCSNNTSWATSRSRRSTSTVICRTSTTSSCCLPARPAVGSCPASILSDTARSGAGPTASGTRDGGSWPGGCGTAARWSRSAAR